MKQHITPKQLNELSEKGKKRLRKWWKPIDGDLYARFSNNMIWPMLAHGVAKLKKENNLPLLSIGQMIEFLIVKNPLAVILIDGDLYTEVAPNGAAIDDGLITDDDSEKIFKKENTCNALWEAVKDVLDK